MPHTAKILLLLGLCFPLGLSAQASTSKGQGSDHVVKSCTPSKASGTATISDLSPDKVLAAILSDDNLHLNGNEEEKKNHAGYNGVSKEKTFIVHVAVWKTDTFPTPVTGTTVALGQHLDQSQWAAFDQEINKKGKPSLKLRPLRFDSNGNPILFNATSATLIAVNHFDTPVSQSSVTIKYAVSTTPTPKQNITDLTTLLSTLAGATTPGAGLEAPKAPAAPSANVVTTCPITPDSPLPVSINIGYTLQPIAPPLTQVSLSPPNGLDFSNQALNTTTAQILTITNNSGTLNFTTAAGGNIPKFDISSANATDFTVAKTTCDQTLAANASCTVTIAFKPTANGPQAATLSIPDDAPGNFQKVALTGIGGSTPPKPAAFTAGGKPPTNPATNTSATQQTNNTTKLSQNNQTPTQTGASPTDCSAVTSDNACTISRSVVDYDKEYWDVGLGLSIPGVRERNYNAANLTAKPSIITHTDVYGYVDWYFDGNRNSGVPHLSIGIPASGAPFHRPFFGFSFPISHWFGLDQTTPFALNIVGGVVYMEQYHVTNDPAGKLELATGRTWKGMVGIEVPLAQLIGRVSKIGK